MKKEVIVLLLLGIFLISPLVLAQEQAQTYSGFGRFIDNVKMFFASGDGDVKLALEIREKEVNSAVINTKNGEDKDAEKNLENAWKKLQLVQEKVSINTAEKVKESSSEVREKIRTQENLPNSFDVYVLEEEKTGLTAEWVIEVNGKEGQTLEREVNVIMGEDDAQNRVMQIETRIGEIDGEINNWVVENSVGKDGGGDNGLTWEVKTEVANGDNGLKPEVKTYMDVVKNNVIDKSPMTKDNKDVTPTQNIIDNDMCEEGEENCNNNIAPGPDGIVGVIVPEPRDNGAPSDFVDNSEESNDAGEDSGGDSGITGEVIGTNNKNSFLGQILQKIFGV